MAKKSAPTKQTAAAALLHKLLGAVAEAIANDPAIAKVAEDSYGLFIDGGAEADELEDDGFEDDGDDEEEEEEPKPKSRGKAAAAAPKGKVARRKQPTAEDLAAAITDGDLSCLDDCDEDMLHEIAALTKVATAAKLRKMSADEIIDALYEKFGDDDGDDGEEEELDDGFEDDGDDNVDEFDVDEATPDELREFAKENGVIKAVVLKKEFSGNDKRTVAKLRKLIAEWMDEQEDEEDDGDDFGDEEFDD